MQIKYDPIFVAAVLLMCPTTGPVSFPGFDSYGECCAAAVAHCQRRGRNTFFSCTALTGSRRVNC